jgi:tetratricopeptide (TPR) repeat protein
VSTLAMAQLAAGDPAAALPAEQEALAQFRELGDGVAEAIVQLQLGQVLIGLERWAEAVAHLRESLALRGCFESFAEERDRWRAEARLGRGIARARPTHARQPPVRRELQTPAG